MATIGLYIDGFNMYHALDGLNKPHLKWLDLWALAERLATNDEQVVRVVYCSAYRTDDVSKMLRHRAYIKALTATGVECLLGHFINETRDCRKCGHQWSAPTEKQGDVSLALAVIDDAHRNVVDRAYLLTGDSDQAATIKLYLNRYPDRQIISVAPPGRYHHAMLRDLASRSVKIEPSELELCLLPALAGPPGAPARRPPEYAPPGT